MADTFKGVDVSNTGIASCDLPFNLYGCGTQLITLRKEHVLRVFEDKVLRNVGGKPKRRTCYLQSALTYL